MELFSRNLKALRLEGELTQAELAKELNISRDAVSSYESGRRQPDLNLLVKIAAFFGVSVDYLLGLSGEKRLTYVRPLASDTKH